MCRASLALLQLVVVACAGFGSGLSLQEFRTDYGAEFLVVDRMVLVSMSRCRFPAVIGIDYFEHDHNIYLRSDQSDSGYCPSPLTVDLRYTNLPSDWTSRVFWVDDTPARPRWWRELVYAMTLGHFGEYLPAEAVTHRIEFVSPRVPTP